MKFVHTADWQLGKPFARITEDRKRSLVQQQRFEVITRIGEVAQANDAQFILVAGDLFDSTSADKGTVSAACSAIGKLSVPVVVIPGNHDHGGPGSIWEQEFYRKQQEDLAPNLHVCLNNDPWIGDGCAVFPCPLMRRTDINDPTEWLRDGEALQAQGAISARIILGHGSTQDFTGMEDEEEVGGGAANYIRLDRLPMDDIDYVALGDWHGTKKVGEKAWYSGTPELDRFQKGGDHQPGHVLVVDVERGRAPIVEQVVTAKLNWLEFTHHFDEDAGLELFKQRLTELLETRADEDLLQLTLTGSLGIAAADQLETELDALENRLLRLKADNQVSIAPTQEEILALTQQSEDPLIARVAGRLLSMIEGNAEEADVAAIALRELFAASRREVGA